MDNLNLCYLSIIKADKGEYLISNGLDTILVPNIAAKALTLFDGKNSVQEVSEIIDNINGTHVDVKSFLDNLSDMGMLIDKNKKPSIFWNYFGGVFNKIVFNKYMMIFSFIIITCAVYSVTVNFGHYFSYQFLFVSKNITFSLLIYFILTWICVGQHELTHFLCAAGNNVHAHITLGTRLQFLVAQTIIDDPYKASKKARIQIYLVGILVDSFISAICVLCISLTDIPFIQNIFRCILYIKVTAIIWQFLFYMKTDMYYVFTTITNQYNLMSGAENAIKKRKYPNKYVHFYAYFLLIGRSISLMYFILFTVPVIWLAFDKILIAKNISEQIFSSLLLLLNWSILLITFTKQKIIPHFSN